MTEHAREGTAYEDDVWGQTRSSGTHSIRFSGHADTRVATCSCGAWGRALEGQPAAELADAFNSHANPAVSVGAATPPAVSAHSQTAGGAATRTQASAAAPAPLTPRTGIFTSSAREAQTQISNLFAGGVTLIVVCGALAVIFMSRAFGGPTDDNHTGALLGFIATSLLAWAGQIMVLVATIAWGVRLGTDASARRREA